MGSTSTERRAQDADLFRLLVDRVLDYAIFLLTPDGHIASWNAGAQRLKGYTADEIIGRHLETFYPPEDRAAGKPARLLGIARRDGRVEDEGFRVRKDGTRFWADVVITALRDESGSLVGFAKVTRDLTERRDAERERAQRMAAELAAERVAKLYEAEQQARAEAEAAVRAQDEFLSIASHELRTPVAAVKATAQLAQRAIQRGRFETDRLDRYMERIARASDRLNALVDDLLDVSRLRTGQLQLRCEKFDLVAVTQEIVDRYDVAESGHTFRFRPPAEAVEVYADPLRIEQVLDNFLSNAVKYSPHGGEITVHLAAEATGVTLTVADHGIGLPAGSENRIFETFGRAPNAAAQQIPGLGLGLSICRQLIERHGGRIWAISAGEEQGTTLAFWLPLNERR